MAICLVFPLNLRDPTDGWQVSLASKSKEKSQTEASRSRSSSSIPRALPVLCFVQVSHGLPIRRIDESSKADICFSILMGVIMWLTNTKIFRIAL